VSKSIPTSISALNTINYRARAPGRAQDWDGLIDDLNAFWSTSVWIWGGHVWPTSSPWENTDTAYVQDNDNATRPLNEVVPVGSARRVKNDGDVELGFVAYGENIDLQVTLVNQSTTTTIGTLTDSIGAEQQSSTWSDFSLTDTGDAGGDPGLVTAKIEAKAPSSEPAKLYAIEVGERIISSTSKLPDGT